MEYYCCTENTKFHNMYITLRTGFHVKSKCLNVGRVPAGFWPAAWAGAADLLGRVSQTRTVLKSKHKQISFLLKKLFCSNWQKVLLFLLHLSLLRSKMLKDTKRQKPFAFSFLLANIIFPSMFSASHLILIKKWKDVTERQKPFAFSFLLANIIFPSMFSASHLIFSHKGDIRYPPILQCSQ